MQIFNYKISKNIFVKAEITKLTPFPIKNDTDNYYVVIPSVVSQLPNNVMFIPKIMIIDPHTNAEYTPEIVKLGVTLAESISTGLSKGIEIKLLIIDNVEDLADISSITTVKIEGANKSKREKNTKNDNIQKEENSKPFDKEQEYLLRAIDNNKEIIDYISDNDVVENNNIDNIETTQIDDNVQEKDKSSVAKTRRKRRKRDPITGELVDNDELTN